MRKVLIMVGEGAVICHGSQMLIEADIIHVLLIEFAQASAESTTKPLEVVQQIPVPDIPKNRRDKSLQILVKSNA